MPAAGEDSHGPGEHAARGSLAEDETPDERARRGPPDPAETPDRKVSTPIQAQSRFLDRLESAPPLRCSGGTRAAGRSR